jgi:hypothetical protein
MAPFHGPNLCGDLIRAAMRFVSYNDRESVAAALKPRTCSPTWSR